MRVKGIHQIRRFVRLVRLEERDSASRTTVERNPIGPRTLPSNPASTTGQRCKELSAATAYPTIVSTHCQIRG